MARFDSPLERGLPTVELVEEFIEQITRRTGMRYGRICHRLSRADTPDQAVGSADGPGPGGVVSEVLFVYADRLHQIRRRHPERISHFGLNFTDASTSRLIDRTHSDFRWCFQPLLRVLDGSIVAAEAMSGENREELLTWTALSGVFDDVLGGVGELSTSHLPARTLNQPETVKTLEELVHMLTGMALSWAW
jgi:hypothetical protein